MPPVCVGIVIKSSGLRSKMSGVEIDADMFHKYFITEYKLKIYKAMVGTVINMSQSIVEIPENN